MFAFAAEFEIKFREGLPTHFSLRVNSNWIRTTCSQAEAGDEGDDDGFNLEVSPEAELTRCTTCNKDRILEKFIL